MAEQNTTSEAQTTSQQTKTGKSRRGFASMDKERHKSVSSRGGKSQRSTFNNRHNRKSRGYEGL